MRKHKLLEMKGLDNKSRVVAVVPAREGSKRLPDKNILDFDGKPLIAHTIEAACESSQVSKVIVSTDSKKIADIAKTYGADVPFLRPSELASDTASFDDMLLHALEALNARDLYDIVIVLQPTSPLRTTKDIDNAICMINERQAEGVVSVCECEHHPKWSGVLPPDSNMANFIDSEYLKRSQDLAKYYRLNGAVYCFNVEYVMRNGGVRYTEGVIAYEMGKAASIDIDEQFDFDLALLIKKHLSSVNNS